jgi:succinate dehydrogenase / fumarate reductase cytochrome b subunit
MADVNRGNRPLSPHLQIYRPQLNSITSILTRITGNALLLGTLMVAWLFLAAATNAEYFAFADAVLTSWFGDLVMLGSALAIWYHLFAGLRHLIWDNGYGLDMEKSDAMGVGIIIASVAMSIVTIVAV